jgi:YbgC/YbaW family acyl-CoA thioester hydrolase
MPPTIAEPTADGYDAARCHQAAGQAKAASMIRTYRVCLADTDATGIVYHARYFEMAERNHNELLLSIGISVADLARRIRDGTGNVALALHSAAARFAKPALPNDLLTLETEVRKHSPARSRWRTIITRDGALICAIDAELVCINVLTGQAVMMPFSMDEAIGRVAMEWIAAASGAGA